MKIFYSSGIYPAHSLIFEVDPRWEEVTDQISADVVVVLDQYASVTIEPKQILLVLTVFHIDHGYDQQYYERIRNKFISLVNLPNVLVLMMNKRVPESGGLIYLDYLFERQKMYCIDYEKLPHPNDRTCTNSAAKDMYLLHTMALTPIKKFLAPMRVSIEPSGVIADRMAWRMRLRSILLEEDDVYVSHDYNPLLPNGSNETTSWLIQSYSLSSAWFPVSYEYYDQTLVSVYVETLVSSDISCVTEKTFDPLIMGNFILPYGYKGLIKDIIGYGFRLPRWIDYSYDEIQDDLERFNAFINSFKQLRKMNITEMLSLAQTDSSLREDNRRVFYNRPYKDLYSKIKNYT